MASALFSAQIHNLADPVEVSSAGLLTDNRSVSREVPEEVQVVMAPYGIDLREHRSRQVDASMVSQADLVIGMTRRHVQEAVLLDPACWPKAFMLKEFIRRGSDIGPRRPEQGIRSWIDSVHGDRSRATLAHRSTAEEVADPYGGTLAEYRLTAVELAQLTSQLAWLLWPDRPDAPVG
jgi:protein-tyrosine-phosphatase